MWLLCTVMTSLGVLTAGVAAPVVYMNQFAVHVPKGAESADAVATRHGFLNLGQIGSLPGFYLFEHQHVHKRSTTASDHHYEALLSDKQVAWVQQQHEKRRVKRDFTKMSPQLQRRDATRNGSFPDPLYKEQWYLNGGAKGGLHMNVTEAWKKGYTGKGVVVSILDDGIQTNHPDLLLNYDPLASTDINDNDADPMPRDNGDNKHGTRCAGEVAAVAFNNYCGVGVAYNASIGGVRMLDGTVNDAVEARALGLNPEHVDVYSASWGPEDDGKTVDGPGPLARRTFVHGVTSGRKGKGSIFVWASGNGGRHTDSCNCDGYTNSIFTLSISSATQAGYKPWYLEECSSTLATTYSSGTPGRDKSVATVDMDGKLRPDHICTVEHTGTSASAPLAAGIVALALEANPNLTWRDVQYLVVITSRPAPLESESGWSLNGINRKVSHKFGYGLMDAGSMVTLAEKWSNVPPQHICKSQEISEDRELESSPGAVLRVFMDVTGCSGTANEVRFLEHVQCKVSLRFMPRGNLRVRLTSPAGTTSTLLTPRPRDLLSSAFDDWPFLSVHYWGEAPDGRWTLDVVNAGGRRVTQPGILKKWQLIFYGTATKPINIRSTPSQTGSGGDEQGKASAIGDWRVNGQQLRQGSVEGGIANDMGNKALGGNRTSTTTQQQQQQQQADVDTGQEALMDDDENNIKILHSCDNECDAQGCYGKGPTQCISCRHYRLDNSCVSRCPPRSFPSQGGVCWPCHESCETCAGPGQDSCLTCAPAHLRLTDLAVCLQQCPDGYLENSEQGICEACASNCATCMDTRDRCASCERHLLLYEAKCHATCPPKTYETEGYTCSPCHESCDSCRGESSDECVTCRRGLFFLEGACRDICPSGFRPDSRRRECVQCGAGCASCSASACLTCAKGWQLSSRGTARCVPQGNDHCDSAEYEAGGGRCRPCHSTCEACDGPTESACLGCAAPLLLQGRKCQAACAQGWYADTQRSTCVRCVHTCQACESRLNCTQCTPGLLLQSGECRHTCATGYYSDRGVCAKCYLSCMTCSGPRRDQCVTCPRGWQLAAGECLPECPEGFFQSQFGCEKCHHYCRTCDGEGPLHCTTCPPRAMLDESGLCVQCLDSQYYDPLTQICRGCHSSCRSCQGPGAAGCSSCSPPLHLDRRSNRCLACCARALRTDCCPCDNRTGECHSWSPAGKRRTKTQQQFSEAVGYVGVGASLQNSLASEVDGGGRAAAFYTVTALAVACCLGVVILFGVIFAALQVKSRWWYKSRLMRRGEGYEALRKRRQRRRRRQRQTDREASDGEDEEEEEEDEEDGATTRTRRRRRDEATTTSASGDEEDELTVEVEERAQLVTRT